MYLQLGCAGRSQAGDGVIMQVAGPRDIIFCAFVVSISGPSDHSADQPYAERVIETHGYPDKLLR
jgi:hypothetical protein